jgi:hypothetical protein
LEIRETGALVELRWPASGDPYQVESTLTLGPLSNWQTWPEPPATVGDRRVLVVTPTEATRFFRLRAVALEPVTVTWTSPAGGEVGVSVKRESTFRLSAPLAPATQVNGERFYATAAGRRLLARPELGSDRRTLSLFYLENLPAGARVEVVLDGTGWTSAAGEPVDLDGDGLPGGTAVLRFETTSTAPLANTAVVGRVLASEPGPGGADVPLPGVTITVDGQEETLRAVTDAQGEFRLQPCPAGRFFVNVDGRTSPLSQWPNGAYYPTIGKGWEAVAGRTNNLAGGTAAEAGPQHPPVRLEAVDSGDVRSGRGRGRDQSAGRRTPGRFPVPARCGGHGTELPRQLRHAGPQSRPGGERRAGVGGRRLGRPAGGEFRPGGHRGGAADGDRAGGFSARSAPR